MRSTVATWNLGTISAFAWKQRENEKACVEMAGRRTFRMHTDYQTVVRQTKDYKNPLALSFLNIYAVALLII
jgi:hypothetical protein